MYEHAATQELPLLFEGGVAAKDLATAAEELGIAGAAAANGPGSTSLLPHAETDRMGPCRGHFGSVRVLGFVLCVLALCVAALASSVVVSGGGGAIGRGGAPGRELLRGQRSPRRRKSRSGFFLQLSDVHLDPWYNASLGPRCFCSGLEVAKSAGAGTGTIPARQCEDGATGNRFGQHGCDSSMALLQATLAAAAAEAPPGGYDWVMLTGDYVRHRVFELPAQERQAAVRKIITELVLTVRKYFNSTDVHHGFDHELFSLGNNDFARNYNMTVTDPLQGVNPWFASLDPLFPSELPRSAKLSSVTEGPQNASITFALGGFFLRKLLDGLYLISLNTVVYAAAHHEAGSLPDDPFGQLKWLQQTLRWLRGAGAGAKALIVGHIPPTLDHFLFKPMWLRRFADAYTRIVSQYADVIAGQLFAHLHMSTVRLLPVGLPLFAAGAVSPVYQNNPSFRVWLYEGAQLLDYRDFAAELRTDGPQDELQFEAGPSALETFGLSSLSASEWRRHVAEPLLREEAEPWRRYVDALWLRTSGKRRRTALESKAFRVRAACAMLHQRAADFASCLDEHGASA